MTNSQSKPAFANHGKALNDKPVLPLIDDEEDVDIDDSRATTFKLFTVPTDNTSAKYSYKVGIIDGTATVRQTIKWAERMNKVFNGLQLNDAANRHSLLMEMISGSAKTSYDTQVRGSRALRWEALRSQALEAVAARDVANGETAEAFRARQDAAWNGVAEPALNTDDINSGMNAVIEAACPYKALEKQKRFMRRKMRKPNDMTTRKYVNCLLRINDTELPHLPPFGGATQKLAADELVDIVCFGIPKSWMRKMDEHDFDPFAAHLGDLIAFCERMESAEDFERGPETKQSANSSKKSSKKYKSTRNNASGSGTGKWCHYHETDTHDTKDCETLKKLKASKSSGSDAKPPFKNKTWKRQSSDAKSYTKKELSAIVEKASKAAVKNALKGKKAECNAVAKRKNASTESDSDASDSECSVNMLDSKMKEVDKQLADFDFGNVSDGEISV